MRLRPALRQPVGNGELLVNFWYRPLLAQIAVVAEGGIGPCAGGSAQGAGDPGMVRRPAGHDPTGEPELFLHFRTRPLFPEIAVVAEGGVGFGGLVGMAQPGMLGLGVRAVGGGGCFMCGRPSH